MCRNIRTLHHFEPPATLEEIQASALQFVRKVSGMRAPSKKNREPFDDAVAEVTRVVVELFAHLESHGAPRNREVERTKAMQRARQRA